MKPDWKGVMPAITTPFTSEGAVDHAFLARHATWLVDNGCTAIVACGSLGEGATLSFEEKVAVVATLVEAVGRRVPVITGIAALSTREAVELAKASQDAGGTGLMVLPPYVYSTEWREMKAHVSAIIRATPLSCMLYNNPIAYRTDFLPEQVAELAAEHANLHAVKESSADVRRVTAIKAVLGNRLTIAVGVDDVLVEGVAAGATGWVAGLVNAMPRESVELFNLALAGQWTKAAPLYQWFLPLLRMDTVVKFVQLIKLVQHAVGMGTTTVRPPRLELAGQELADAEAAIKAALASRPPFG
jgi:4-hydroxy-tetrahydrodipicolinate synthase